MKREVIIVAGGNGLRMKTDVPKQFLELGGKPILIHSIEKFHLFDPQIHIILVLPKNQFETWHQLCKKHHISLPHSVVAGGDERFFSVKNGLSALEGNSLVAVHDAVRPFVSLETIEKCFTTAEKVGNAVPCCNLNDSIRKVDGDKNFAANRSEFRTIQTPQIFRSDLLLRAYEQPFSAHFTDDASVVEALGEPIFLVEGNSENIKITTHFDLIVGNALLNR